MNPPVRRSARDSKTPRDAHTNHSSVTTPLHVSHARFPHHRRRRLFAPRARSAASAPSLSRSLSLAPLPPPSSSSSLASSLTLGALRDITVILGHVVRSRAVRSPNRSSAGRNQTDQSVVSFIHSCVRSCVRSFARSSRTRTRALAIASRSSPRYRSRAGECRARIHPRARASSSKSGDRSMGREGG